MGIEQWKLTDPLLKSDVEFNAVSEPMSDINAPASNLNESVDLPSDFNKTNINIEQTKVSIDQHSTVQSNNDVVTIDTNIVKQKESDEAETVVQKHDWSSLLALLDDQQFCSSCADVKPILGDGDLNADWMFVFDSPTTRDIEQQKLLTGRVGQLFDAILIALNLDRESIYLSSIFKCPPAENISLNQAQCDDLLEHQIQLVQPKVVITFGEFTAQALIKANEDLDQLRTQEQRCLNQSVRVVPTFSLMQILDAPKLKAKVWDDLKSARQLLES